MSVHPVAFAHARSLPEADARSLCHADPERVSVNGVLGGEDAHHLVTACRALLFKCYCCGELKPGLEFDNSGTDLCLRCYEYAGWENQHSDYNHDEHPDPNCPVCRDEREAAEDRAIALHEARMDALTDDADHPY